MKCDPTNEAHKPRDSVVSLRCVDKKESTSKLSRCQRDGWVGKSASLQAWDLSFILGTYITEEENSLS